MATRMRIIIGFALLLTAGLACSLPLGDTTPPDFTATQAPVVQVPSETPSPADTHTSVPAVSATPFPTLTPPPTHTVSPVPALTFTATHSPTVTASSTSAYSPTPPPTITAPAKSKTPTKTHTAPASARVAWNAPFFTPTLDGDWGEWKNVSTEYPAGAVVYGRGNWTGETDLEASFHVAWDTSYLYIAVKARDDLYVQNATGAELYLGDSLEVLFDANYLGDYDTPSLSPDDFQLGISPGLGQPGGEHEAYLWFPRGAQGTKPVKVAATGSDGVYRVEAAIPWSLFGVSPQAGGRYGFALSVSDNDSVDANRQESMVSSAAGRVLVDPTTWGELRLK